MGSSPRLRHRAGSPACPVCLETPFRRVRPAQLAGGAGEGEARRFLARGTELRTKLAVLRSFPGAEIEASRASWPTGDGKRRRAPGHPTPAQAEATPSSRCLHRFVPEPSRTTPGTTTLGTASATPNLGIDVLENSARRHTMREPARPLPGGGPALHQQPRPPCPQARHHPSRFVARCFASSTA